MVVYVGEGVVKRDTLGTMKRGRETRPQMLAKFDLPSLSFTGDLPIPWYLAQELHAILPYMEAEVLQAVADD